MDKLKICIKKDLVKVFPAFNIDGVVYAEDNPDTPTITKPSQRGYGILHLGGEVEWVSNEDFKDDYIPYDTHKERLMYLRDEIKKEIDDSSLELKLARDSTDYPLMDIMMASLITCYKVLEERISRMK